MILLASTETMKPYSNMLESRDSVPNEGVTKGVTLCDKIVGDMRAIEESMVVFLSQTFFEHRLINFILQKQSKHQNVGRKAKNILCGKQHVDTTVHMPSCTKSEPKGKVFLSLVWSNLTGFQEGFSSLKLVYT